jgi:hypothetical protein
MRMNGDVALALFGLRKWLGENAMMAYLAMMAVRLLELRRVLKLDASLFLHCDPTASHYLKLILDAIFGAQDFTNEIIWQRTTPNRLELDEMWSFDRRSNAARATAKLLERAITSSCGPSILTISNDRSSMKKTSAPLNPATDMRLNVSRTRPWLLHYRTMVRPAKSAAGRWAWWRILLRSETILGSGPFCVIDVVRPVVFLSTQQIDPQRRKPPRNNSSLDQSRMRNRLDELCTVAGRRLCD